MQLARFSCLVAALLAASSARGQQGSESELTVQGWFVQPSLRVGALLDDNFLLLDEPPQEVRYAQLTGTFDTIRQGATSRFSAGYTVSAEIFPKRITFPSRQGASLSFQSQFTSRSALQVDAGYLLSHNPTELIDATGIELGRRRSQGYTAGVDFSRGLAPFHSLSANYRFGYRKLGGGLDDDIRTATQAHVATLSWQQNYSARSIGTLSYGFSLFVGADLAPLSDVPNTSKSHRVTYGWTRNLTAHSVITLTLGPRAAEVPIAVENADGIDVAREWRLSLDALASFQYSWERSSFSVSYSRNQNQSFGATGRVDTESLLLRLTIVPARRLSIGVSPGVYRNITVAQTADTLRVAVDARWELAQWLSISGGYGYSLQERLLGVIDVTDVDVGDAISRNSARIGIDFGFGKLIPLN